MPGNNASNDRGSTFERRVHAVLFALAERHPGLVEVNSQVELSLLNGQSRRPDFELIYRLDQEHHELIECQSRQRSSLEIADKIKTIKALSARNRFVFVFEERLNLSPEHRRILEDDGVNCLSFMDLEMKLDQLGWALRAIKDSLGSSYELVTWEDVLRRWHARYGPNAEFRKYGKPSTARPEHLDD